MKITKNKKIIFKISTNKCGADCVYGGFIYFILFLIGCISLNLFIEWLFCACQAKRFVEFACPRESPSLSLGRDLDARL